VEVEDLMIRKSDGRLGIYDVVIAKLLEQRGIWGPSSSCGIEEGRK